jgi:hypothetical protein
MGCGGGLPLLHPARTLDQGEVRAAAGFSGNVALGGFGTALNAARNEAAQAPSGTGGSDATYAQGALVAASIAPGLAPFLAARVGLGASFEGGLAYTGRAVRVDVRRGFDLSRGLTFSAGAGGSAALYGHQDGSALPSVDIGDLHGWGADLPLLFGYSSEGDLYRIWCGARGGWEHVDISAETSEPGASTLGPSPVGLAATRFWGGGLLGFAAGFRHIHLAVELDASYATVTGEYAGVHTRVQGLTLAPASALWWHF